MANQDPTQIGANDPTVAKQIERETQVAERTTIVVSPATVNAAGAETTPAVTETFLNLSPIVTDVNTIYPQSTTETSANAVTITSSINNDTGDVTTVYATDGKVIVNPVNQTINQYTAINAGVAQIIAGNNITITSSGGDGTGIVRINATGGGGGNGDYSNSNVAAYLPTYTGNISANNITITGNLTGGNLGNIITVNLDGNSSNILHGDGSWSADATDYGNSNVANYLPTYTGNIGELSFANANAGKIESNSNIQLNAANYTWSFNTDGGLTLPDSGQIKNGSWYDNSNLSLKFEKFLFGNFQTIMGIDSYQGYIYSQNLQNGSTSTVFANAGDGSVMLSARANANVTTSVWDFAGNGVITLPANTIAINYRNGSAVFGNIVSINLDGNASNVLRGDGTFGPDATSSYGDSNVTSLLGSFGSNTISTTGDVETGNLNATVTSNATGAGATVGVKGTLTVDSTFGSTDPNNPASAQGVRGRITGANLTANSTYLVGVTGQYLVTGTNSSDFVKAGVLGVVGDQTTTADAAIVAYLDGDGGLTTANAAYAVSMKNSTPGSGFKYGLDLAWLDLGLGLTAPFSNADIRLNNNVEIKSNITNTMVVDGNVTTTGTLQTVDLNVVGNVTSNLLPNANVTFDLGSNTQRWNNLWLANSTIYLGDAVLSANGNTLIVDNLSVTNSNVNSIGNIAAINLDGNVSNVLAGDGTWIAAGSGGGTSLPYLELTNPQLESLFTGTPVNFIKEDYGFEVDTIAANVEITRGTNQGIYNPSEESGWNVDVSPVNTLWNADGWQDLANVESRNFTNFFAAVNQNLGYNVPYLELVMKDTLNNTYYTVKFTHWTGQGNGGGIQYERRLINQAIYFTKTNYGNEVDNIGANVAITRANNGGIYNPLEESSWDEDVSPVNTLWNSDGWNNFVDITNRVYAPFFTAVNELLGDHVPGAELIMHDTVNDQYYAVMFTQWTQGNEGGGFSYVRRLINTPQTGITFSDGSVQNTAFDLGNLPMLPKYNFMMYDDDGFPNTIGQAAFDPEDNELRLSPVTADGINQYEFFDYIYATSLGSKIKVTSTVDPNTSIQYKVTNVVPGNYVRYRDYEAGVNRIYGNDPNINQIIITRSFLDPVYSNDNDTNSDNFTASGINTNFVAMVNVYGSDAINPISINSLANFFKTFVDVVIYGGGASVVTISEMQTAFYNNINVLEAALPNGSLYKDFTFFAGTSSYTSVTNSGGTGSGFALDVTLKGNGTYDITVTNSGTLYTAGDVVTVLGTDLGGASPNNDLTITVDSVDVGGEILTYTLAGTPEYGIRWPDNYISDGGDDQYDNGNYLNTNLGTEISYNGGVIVNTSPAFANGDYFVAFKGSIFAMIATSVSSSVNSVFYSGGLGADSNGVEIARPLLMPKYYTFTVQTLNQNGYIGYQWNTQWYVEVDLNGPQTTAPTSISNGTSNIGIPTTDGSIQFNYNSTFAGLIDTRVAIGANAGYYSNLNGYSVSIGESAGNTNQGYETVAIGHAAGNLNQGNISIAIGYNAAYANQQGSAVAIGQGAGGNNQGDSSIAIGPLVAQENQGLLAIAIGSQTGYTSQGNFSIAVGQEAGYTGQGVSSIAIGRFAGKNNQGSNSIAIGTNAGNTSQHNNSIILNATGSNLDSTVANAFYVSPIRNDTGNKGNVVFYNTTTKELTYAVVGNVISTNLDGNASNVLHGDGSWSADVTNYGNSNVANYLPTYNGNIGKLSFANANSEFTIEGNSGAYLKLDGPNNVKLSSNSGNTEIVANGFVTKFSNDGKLMLSGNTVAISFANGAAAFGNIVSINTDGNSGNILYGNGVFAAAPSGGSYGDSNVTTLLGSFGSNSISTTGNVTANNFSGNTNGFTIGYLNIPQVSFGANATLALTDAGKHYYSTTAGNLTLTIPDNGNVAFATGAAINIVVQASGNVLVNAAAGVTLYLAGNSTSANRVISTYGMATLIKVGTDTWFISGTGVS